MTVTRWIGLTVAALVFLVDQLSKMFVVASLGVNHDLVRSALANGFPPESPSRVIVSIFDLRFVPNIGVSLGLMQASSDVMRWGLVALRGAIAAGGAGLRDHAQASGDPGNFQHRFLVYGREAKPCRGTAPGHGGGPKKACKGTIKRIVQAGRSTFYCPACQK